MQSKSTRGVQQEDVWVAADALIEEGLRPTIERVRQKMGRGSPNTVSPGRTDRHRPKPKRVLKGGHHEWL